MEQRRKRKMKLDGISNVAHGGGAEDDPFLSEILIRLWTHCFGEIHEGEGGFCGWVESLC